MRSLRRSLLMAASFVLAGTLGVTVPGPATAAPTRPSRPALLASVPGSDGVVKAPPSDPNPALKAAPPQSAWPKAGFAEITLPSTAAAASAGGGARQWSFASGLPVAARPRLAASGTKSAGALTSPAKVGVRVEDHDVARRSGYDVMVRLNRTDGGTTGAPLSVAVSYAGFRNAYGGDWAGRLRLVSVPDCAATTPDAAGCRATVVPSVNDRAAGLVSADVSVAATGTTLALAGGPSSDGGTFAATDLAASGSWSAGGSSGGFGWTYPMRSPPSLGGPKPPLALSYSSQGVDGMTAATNAQPSWVGEGFGWQPGSIERSYRTCSDDGQAGSSDLCWVTDNATISLNGHTNTLIYDAASGQWRPDGEDGSIVERLTDASLGNGDDDNEYWKVTTTDGMQYFFGKHKLPGAPAGAETNSVFYEPVFGNNTGEPCHGSTFAASSCQQAYRWNLDYVIDTHGNTMSFYYTRELNQYARNGSTSTVVSYVRGGYLREIDYGTRLDNGVDTAFSGTAPARVLTEVADRCVTQGATCTTATANQSNWPDVPLDLLCSGSGCAGRNGPSFFTSKMLTAITTQVANGTKSWRRVERWTFNHEFKAPGDGNQPVLWLSTIGHCGTDDNTCMPNVTLTSVQKSNRVDTTGTTNSIIRYRLGSIVNEIGGVTTVTYSTPECVKDSVMPTSPETNTLRCYPQYWTPTGASGPKLEYFHKYVVNSVAETDLTGTAPDEVSYYTYVGGGAWHRDDNPLTLTNRRTYNGWRGYELVRTVLGAASQTQSKSEARYFRGMNGDVLPSGTRSAAVVDSDGVSWPDEPWLAGITRETVSFLGNSATVYATSKEDPYVYGPTASQTVNGITQNAYATGTAVVTARSWLDHGTGWQVTRATNTFSGDRTARVVQTDDEGDTSTTADDRCTRYTFGANAAGTFVIAPVRAETVGVRCSATPNRATDVVADARFVYDGASGYGTTIGKGEVTRTEQMSSWSGGTATYQTTARQAFDANGRITSVTDALNNVTLTAYTPASGAPVTKTVITNPMGWESTSEIDPAWGSPTATIDMNGRRTDATYDGLGRVTAVWLPGRTKGVDTPDVKYTYTIRNTGGISSITTSRLNTAGTAYLSTYELLDGKARPRQKQTPAVGGGRTIVETLYDSRGNAVKTRPGYFNSAGPGTTLFVPTGDAAVPAQTVTTYDGLNRVSIEAFQLSAVEHSRAVTTYGGDHAETSAPAGGSATSTWVDAQGRTTQLRSYRANTATGSYDASFRTYSSSGELTSLTDAAGNKWTYVWDQMHRKISETDPDKGTSTFTYDELGRQTSATDARGVKLIYTYDKLSRKTAEYVGSVTPANKQAEWVYDTILKGPLTSSTRYVNGDAYTTATTSFDQRYRPTGAKVSIPASAGTLLAGDYLSSSTYNVDGTIATATLPAKSGSSTTGGLAPETLTFGYNSIGLPTTQSGLDTYATDTQYLQTGELSSINATIGNGKNVLQYWNYEPGTGRLAGHQVLADIPGTVAADVHYAYDKAGNVTSVADTLSSYGTGTDDTQCFRYDGARHLTEAWTPGTGSCAANPTTAGLGGPAPYWSSYTYDAAGARKTEVRHTTAGDLTRTSAYPAAGPSAVRPHAATTITNSGLSTTVDSFAYDQVGNMTTRSIAGKPSQTLTWSPQGQLTTVTDTGGTTSYVYDASGVRQLAKAADGTTTLYLGSTELKLAGGLVTGTRFYSHAGQLIGVRTTTGVQWQAGDGQGTSHLSLRATDLSLTRRRTDPWGNVRGAAVVWPTSRGFLGKVSDSTGLTHLGAREYDPVTGTFISVDPKLDTGDLQQMAAYSYADNNPVTLDDPEGLHVGDPCEGANNCGIKTPPKPEKEWDEQETKKVPGPPKVLLIKITRHVKIFKVKGIVIAEVYQCVYPPLGVAGPPGCGTFTQALGPATACTRGLDPNSVCFVGANGYAYDLHGTQSCAPVNQVTACGGGQPTMDRGCGPGGSGPGGKPWPQYLGPTNGHEIHMEREIPEFDCGRTDERCKIVKAVSWVTDKLAWCPFAPCAVASLAGNLTISAYYVGQGQYYDAYRHFGEGMLVYGTHRMGGYASAYYLGRHGKDAERLGDWGLHYVTHPSSEYVWDNIMPPKDELEAEGGE
ncbi:RHS repeat domain-containing protein [Catellatospora tritici]|uniref:RHS repeat domain-containing protein n=1 Tax=Catellatospora tritici TaxID=2851566 RepID=UPI001C2DD29B|nr:RHS repeat-associated core domain-containing protein [Catellatospora tritici]MBV1850502.1 hypothetical protein [Catellatospora tritici]